MAPLRIIAFGLSLIPTIFAAVTPGFPYGSQKVRGVNLGGWLVLEVRCCTYMLSRLGY